MSDKVKVRITIREEVKYSRDVVMPREEFERLDKALSSREHHERSEAEEAVRDHIDLEDDWQDSELEEVEQFELVDE